MIATSTKRACREATKAWHDSTPVPTGALMRAKTKPANTSAVRWRMELRRRANAERYAMCGEIPGARRAAW